MNLGTSPAYTYDDYRRLKSVTPPVRGSAITARTRPSFYYGANAMR